jgi:hypothetical protein
MTTHRLLAPLYLYGMAEVALIRLGLQSQHGPTPQKD